MGRFQGIDGRIIQPFAAARLPHRLAPNPQLSDERAIEPLADGLFLHVCLSRDFLDVRRVIFTEGRVNIANGGELLDSDLEGISSTFFPELRANYLKMDRLNVRTEPRFESARVRLHHYPAQIADELRGRFGSEGNALIARRFLDRQPGRFRR